MSGAGSRRKGSKAEIEIAKLLCAWWSRVEPLDTRGRPIQFKRTPLSGGWCDPDVRAGFQASGDLMTTAVRFPFCVEVKRREGWSLKNVVASKPSPVWGWWRQACEAAGETGKEPLLFFRKNNSDWWCIARADYVERFLPCRLEERLRRRNAVYPQLFNAQDFLELAPGRLLRRRRPRTGSRG